MSARVPRPAPGPAPRTWTALALVLGLCACAQPKERQVIRAHDPIDPGVSGQRARLLEKAELLEQRGMHAAALTIYTSLEALYPEDSEIIERARLAALEVQLDTTPGPLVEAVSGSEESLAEDAGANPDQVNDLHP